MHDKDMRLKLEGLHYPISHLFFEGDVAIGRNLKESAQKNPSFQTALQIRKETESTKSIHGVTHGLPFALIFTVHANGNISVEIRHNIDVSGNRLNYEAFPRPNQQTSQLA